ncbi:MAG: hypothetical protein HKN33_05585 [Pyrinomonadaceae bacterium]|nr:hypothetical protein [Pyrinomonadaceae bacterium]
MKRKYLIGIIGVFCLLAAISVSKILDSRKSELTPADEPSELTLKGERLNGYALGAEGLLADWYWMRSLQYIGDKLYKARDQKIDLDNLKPLDPKLLYPLLDNATTLDPEFLAAYSYGANVLPAINPDHAIALAQKGIKNNPNQWSFYHQLGYIYWKLEEFEKASETYAKGAKIEGAPNWMSVMSARMNTAGGSRQTARAIYTRLKDAADSKTRLTAEFRLAELDSLDDRDVLDEVLATFEMRNGRCASSWKELIPLLKDKSPGAGREFRVDRNMNIVDPTDVPYLIEQKSCTAAVDHSRSEIPRN